MTLLNSVSSYLSFHASVVFRQARLCFPEKLMVVFRHPDDTGAFVMETKRTPLREILFPNVAR